MRLAALTLTATALLGLHHVHAATTEPAVIAHYEVRRSGAAPEPLVVVRAADRIEHRYPARHTVEVWRRVSDDEVERVALFPEARRAVRYTQGDLRAIGEPVDWATLSDMVGAAERARMRQVGTVEVHGRVEARFSGSLRGQPATLTWLPDQALPARLTLGRGAASIALKLLAVAPCTAERCAPTDDRGMKRLDFADLGDMTYDPFVKEFLRARGGHAH